MFQITESTSKISFRIVDCVIIHQNIDTGIEYFPKSTKFLRFFAKKTSHEFRLNITPVNVNKSDPICNVVQNFPVQVT